MFGSKGVNSGIESSGIESSGIESSGIESSGIESSGIKPLATYNLARRRTIPKRAYGLVKDSYNLWGCVIACRINFHDPRYIPNRSRNFLGLG
jgi:hypothetical protein